MPDIMPYPTRCRTARFPLSGSAAFDLMCVDQSDTKMGGAKKTHDELIQHGCYQMSFVPVLHFIFLTYSLLLSF